MFELLAKWLIVSMGLDEVCHCFLINLIFFPQLRWNHSPGINCPFHFVVLILVLTEH